MQHKAAWFEAVFEAAGLGIILLGPDCIVRAANGAAEALTGWRRDELTGYFACSELLVAPGGPGTDLFAGALGGHIAGGYDNPLGTEENPYAGPHGCAGLCPYSARPAAPAETEMMPALLRHKSGRAIPVMASVAPLRDGGLADGFALLVWDVTQRVQLEAENALRRRQTEGLQAISREIGALRDLKRGLGAVLERSRALFGMDLIAWGMLDESAGRLTWSAAHGAGSQQFAGYEMEIGGTVMGRVLLANRPFMTQNLAGQAGAPFAAPPMQTGLAVPLRVRENALAVLLVASAAQISLTDEDVMLLTHLGSCLATAVENAELLAQMQHLAMLEERQRLAREMHDSLAQTLTYLGVRNQIITRLAERGDAEGILRETASLKQVIGEAHADMRRSIFQLKESSQPRALLADRWRRILSDFEERTGIQADLAIGDGVPPMLPEQVQLQLTRIMQESLANIRNHSGAVSAVVRLFVEGPDLHLTITDDGCGFDTAQVHGPDQHHFGLSIMRERGTAVGADVTIRSMRGHGTTISLRIPLTREGV
ncbi:MAG: two-component sensor histidine kinase [Symbiobacteriaceae bacterium]|nr:two-component sensor histidine kinase [Symbiobacteriaceae bacterium]